MNTEFPATGSPGVPPIGDGGEVAPASTPLLLEGYCRDCSYPLRGLPEKRCPECGRAFNPADARTFLLQPSESWTKHLAELFGGVERFGAWASVLVVIVVAVASALGRTDLSLWAAFAVGVFYLPIGVGASVLEFETRSGIPWKRLRRVVILGVLAVSIAVTDWPLRLAFVGCRGRLDRLATQAQAGQAPPVPVQAGLFTIRKIDIRGNVVCLWTDPFSAGPKCFAHCARDQVQGKFNLSSTSSLADDWQWIVED